MSEQQEILERIFRLKRRFDEAVWAPATAASLEEVEAYSRTIQQAPLPEGYKRLLAMTDGLSFNGYNIYGSVVHDDPFLEGFREVNEVLGGTPRSHVLYGDTADELFVFGLSSKRFQAVDRSSLSPLEEFESFEAMLVHVLRASIKHVDMDAG